MKNRIWLDVTVSSRWNGPAVGMIRTERKIIEELKKKLWRKVPSIYLRFKWIP